MSWRSAEAAGGEGPEGVPRALRGHSCLSDGGGTRRVQGTGMPGFFQYSQYMDVNGLFWGECVANSFVCFFVFWWVTVRANHLGRYM